MNSAPNPATADKPWNLGFALLVAVAGFMELFDGTVIQTALPTLGRDLGADVATASITIAAYFAAAAATIPICAWLTDRLGVRAAFAGGLVLFALASLACGASPNLGLLTVARIVQGAGGAVMMTVGQIAILRDAPKDKLLRITAYLVWPALAAPVLAPVIGGIITDTVGWRWLFWINVPIGAVAAWLAYRLAPERAEGRAPRKLDVIGAVLLASGMCVLVPALGLVEQGGSPLRLGLIAAGVILCGAAVFWLLRAKQPLLHLDVFGFDTFRSSNSAGAFYRAVIASVPVILTLMFQTGFGWSATTAGLVVMVLFAGNLSIKPFANYSVRRWGYRFVLFASTLVGVVLLVGFAFVTAETNLWVLIPMLYVSGAARSTGFTAYMSMQYVDVPKDRMDYASPLSNTVHQLATAFGLAATIGLLAAVGNDFRATLLAMAAVLLVTALWVRRLPANAGQVARGN